MARTLWRLLVTIVTPFALAGALLSGVGAWRQSSDGEWCRRATAGRTAAASQGLSPAALEEIRTACTVQRQRQRVVFGAIWRTGGRETAQCGFELARLQLVADGDPDGRDALLARYGIDASEFETSDRRDQDRFVQACLAR